MCPSAHCAPFILNRHSRYLRRSVDFAKFLLPPITRLLMQAQVCRVYNDEGGDDDAVGDELEVNLLLVDHAIDCDGSGYVDATTMQIPSIPFTAVTAVTITIVNYHSRVR